MLAPLLVLFPPFVVFASLLLTVTVTLPLLLLSLVLAVLFAEVFFVSVSRDEDADSFATWLDEDCGLAALRSKKGETSLFIASKGCHAGGHGQAVHVAAKKRTEETMLAGRIARLLWAYSGNDALVTNALSVSPVRTKGCLRGKA